MQGLVMPSQPQVPQQYGQQPQQFGQQPQQFVQQPQQFGQPQQLSPQPQYPVAQPVQPGVIAPTMSTQQPGAPQQFIPAQQIPISVQPAGMPGPAQQSMPAIQPLPAGRGAPISQTTPALNPQVMSPTDLQITVPPATAVKAPTETVNDAPQMPPSATAKAMVPGAPATPQIANDNGKTLYMKAPSTQATSVPVKAEEPIPAPIFSIPAGDVK